MSTNDVCFFGGESTKAGIWRGFKEYGDRAKFWGREQVGAVHDAVEWRGWVFYTHTQGNSSALGMWKLGHDPDSEGHATWNWIGINWQSHQPHYLFVKGEYLWMSDGSRLIAVGAPEAPQNMSDFEIIYDIYNGEVGETIVGLSEWDRWLILAIRNNCGTRIVRWDAISRNLIDSSHLISETENIALIKTDNSLRMVAGKRLNIYEYNGYQMRLVGRVPIGTSGATVAPHGVCTHAGQMLIGVGCGQGEAESLAHTGVSGVYSWSKSGVGYAEIISVPHTTSTGNQRSVYVTALASTPGGLFIAWLEWQEGETKWGVDRVIPEIAHEGGFVETALIRAARDDLKDFRVQVPYSKYAPPGIVIECRRNHGEWEVMETEHDKIRRLVEARVRAQRAASFQIRVRIGLCHIEAINIDFV